VLAQLITTLFQGMSIQASEGASIEELLQIANMAVDGILILYINPK